MDIEYKDKAWLILHALQEFGPQRRDQIVGNDDYAAEQLRALMTKRYLRRVDDHVVDISARGKAKLRLVTANSSAYVGDLVAPRTHQGRGTYDGRELGRTCVRPGAYDAYELPSLIGSKRVSRRAA